MPRYRVAHVRQQGFDLIIVPLDRTFQMLSVNDRHETIVDLQTHARGAGLAGTVVPVWDGGGGRMAFIAPHNWHPFFRSLSLQVVAANINKELYWD